MKRVIIVLVLLAAIAAVIFIAPRLRLSGATKKDRPAAPAQDIGTLNKIIPARAVPDVNHSKIISPGAWKKEMEEYAAWLAGTPEANVDRIKRNAILDTLNRNAARLHGDNFIINDTRKKISLQQYTAVWNSAFFANGVRPDSSHRSLAASCYGKKLSLVVVSALTSYVYEVSLIDTAANRRTVFSVFPESSTFLLAPPGTHLMLCTSSYKPGPGMIWRSAPTIIPIIVPQVPSLFSCTLQTQVVREKEKKPDK
jgi:hypothetical protein